MDYKKELIRGVFWTAVEKYSGLIVSIIITMVLARLLSPEDFGVIAIVTVIVQFLTLFCTMGASPAIVQKDNLTQNDLSVIFSSFVIIGVTLAFLLSLAAPYIANFYEDIRLTLIVRILSINLIFAAANLVPNALMIKNLRFRQMALRTLSIQVVTGTVAIFAAYKGLGLYALLISPVATAIYMFFFNSHFYPQKFTLKIRLEPIKKIFSYSAYQFGFDIINFFSRNLDKLIIGKSMSSTELGYYEKSYRLMQLPLSYISSVLSPVMQPVLRTLENERQEMADKYNIIIRLLATISFPLGIILYACSEEIIVLFYGSNWVKAVPSFSILCLSLPLQIILSTSGAIYQAADSTKTQFYVCVLNTGITIIGFLIVALVYNTIEAMAWSWTITLMITFFISFIILYKIVLHSRLLVALHQLFVPLIVSVILLIGFYFIPFPENIVISLVLKMLLGGVITLALIHLLGQYNIVSLIKSVIHHNYKV